MSSSVVVVSALTLAIFATPADADAFLHTQSRADLQLAKAEVEETWSELSGQSNLARLRSIEGELLPMYTALPKGEQGRLEPSTVRYALHRYFVQKHGWYVNGLDPAGGAWTAPASTSIMKDRAPSYIQGLFDERLHGQGLGVHELAVFAATLSDLMHREAVGTLEGLYGALQLSSLGLADQWQSDEVVKAYLVDLLVGGNVSGTDPEELAEMEAVVVDAYPAWGDTWLWAQDFSRAHDLAQASRHNPFVSHSASFDELVGLVQELGHHFGRFQNLECHTLKERLVEMEHEGTGRVLLSRFYSGGLEGDFTFTESVGYLRNLGILDERDPQRPSVVIPNYINSKSNCLSSSNFYSVCCSDECEGLLGHVEQEIAAPHAAPARIAEVVAGLTSDTVTEPRNLSTALLTRLDEIAQLHGGHVPLHGRLFAQWMHHAYPRECPFPHASGTTSPVSPDEWMAEFGVDSLDASEEEMRKHVMSSQGDRASLAPEMKVEALPWVALEELVAEHRRTTSWSASLRNPMAFALVGSFLMLIRTSALVGPSQKSSEMKCDRFLV